MSERVEISDLRLPERFWKKVQPCPVTGCWLWTASLCSDGYAKFGLGKKEDGIGIGHRVAYEALVGRIPPGLHIDHLCRTRRCVNPAHLEPVTTQENTRRGRDSRTACRAGHAYTERTIYMYRGRRMCRECFRLNAIVQRARKRMAVAAQTVAQTVSAC